LGVKRKRYPEIVDASREQKGKAQETKKSDLDRVTRERVPPVGEKYEIIWVDLSCRLIQF